MELVMFLVHDLFWRRVSNPQTSDLTRQFLRDELDHRATAPCLVDALRDIRERL